MRGQWLANNHRDAEGFKLTNTTSYPIFISLNRSIVDLSGRQEDVESCDKRVAVVAAAQTARGLMQPEWTPWRIGRGRLTRRSNLPLPEAD